MSGCAFRVTTQDASDQRRKRNVMILANHANKSAECNGINLAQGQEETDSGKNLGMRVAG